MMSLITPKTANFSHPLDYQAHLAMAKVMKCDPNRPFGHTDVKGDVTVFEKNSKFLTLLDIKEVNDRMNENLGLAIITPKALAPHLQEIDGCGSGGLFGHIYTTDSDNSRWSLHVEKPNSPPETKEESFTQKKLLRKTRRLGFFEPSSA